MEDGPKKGPDGHENWKAALAGAAPGSTFEFFLYSDAEITGDLPATPPCPYAFLNALAFRRQGRLAPVVALRIQSHLDAELPPMNATDTSRYHGGTLVDELAALASLSIGIRFRAGGLTRTFYGDDPIGRPHADTEVPVLPPPAFTRGARVPRALGSHNLNHSLLPQLFKYPQLSPADAVALVRAARLYQDALWVVESEPHLAWLFLVSALEAIATPMHLQTAEASAVLRSSYPKLAELLTEAGGSELLEKVSGHLLPMMRATGRFIDFVVKYLPEPAEPRPHENLQVSWEPTMMKRALARIYDYRSRALHDGTPFPDPMSDPQPFPSDIPTALAASTKGGVWLSEDLPMLIHVFEHITRGSLLNWWNATASEQPG